MSQTVGGTGGHDESYATHPGPKTATPGSVVVPLNDVKLPRTINVCPSITCDPGA